MKIGKSFSAYHVIIVLPDGLQQDFWLDADNYKYLLSLPHPANTRIIITEQRLIGLVERSSNDSLLDIFDLDNYL